MLRALWCVRGDREPFSYEMSSNSMGLVDRYATTVFCLLSSGAGSKTVVPGLKRVRGSQRCPQTREPTCEMLEVRKVDAEAEGWPAGERGMFGGRLSGVIV